MSLGSFRVEDLWYSSGTSHRRERIADCTPATLQDKAPKSGKKLSALAEASQEPACRPNYIPLQGVWTFPRWVVSETALKDHFVRHLGFWHLGVQPKGLDGSTSAGQYSDEQLWDVYMHICTYVCAYRN